MHYWPTLIFAYADGTAPTTNDTNHQGWYEAGKGEAFNRIKRVLWKPIATDCISCQPLVEEYNFTMREVFGYRANIKLFREMQVERGDNYVEIFKYISNFNKGSELEPPTD